MTKITSMAAIAVFCSSVQVAAVGIGGEKEEGPLTTPRVTVEEAATSSGPDVMIPLILLVMVAAAIAAAN